SSGTFPIWELEDEPAITILHSQSAATVRAMTVAGTSEHVLCAAAQHDGTITVHSCDVDPGARESQKPKTSWRQQFSLQILRPNAIAISPDCTQVAVGFFDGQIRFFDANDGKPLLQLRAHQGIVNDLRFTPDGKCLI